jgi:hypothetical protein
MPWDLSDALKLGGVFAMISTNFALTRNKIKVLFKKTDRHQDTLFGSDKEGGLISDVQGTKKDVTYIKKTMDEQNQDIKWIRNHLQNGGKK